MTALEARAAELGGIVVWGTHRDTAELIEIAYPVFSYGACPIGPRRLDRRETDALSSARFGSFFVGKNDAVFADADGVIFTPIEQTEDILFAAESIRRIERAQAEALKSGKTLRGQLQFTDYLERREKDPSYMFQKHLGEIGGAIEE